MGKDPSALASQGWTIPSRKPFMTGNGKVVSPEMAASFAEGIIDGCLGEVTYQRYTFLLGFAAAVDAMSRGTVDFDKPLGTAMQAFDDVENIGPSPCLVTNMMKEVPVR